MHFFKFPVQSENEVALLIWVHVGVIELWSWLRRIVLARLDQSQVLLCKQINQGLFRLLLHDGSPQHLNKNAELFKVPCLVRNLFDILLLEVTSPDEPCKLRFYVNDKPAKRVKTAHFDHGD